MLKPAVAPIQSCSKVSNMNQVHNRVNRGRTRATTIIQSSAINAFPRVIRAEKRRITATAARQTIAMTAPLFRDTSLSDKSSPGGAGPNTLIMPGSTPMALTSHETGSRGSRTRMKEQIPPPTQRNEDRGCPSASFYSRYTIPNPARLTCFFLVYSHPPAPVRKSSTCRYGPGKSWIVDWHSAGSD